MTKSLRTALLSATAVAVFSSSAWVLGAQQGAGAGAAPAQEGGGRGRGRQAGPVLPTPRLPDGTVKLARIPGAQRVWALPHITHMALRLVGSDGQLLPEIQRAQAAARAGGAGARGGGGGGGRGGSKSEPWMPWMPWSAAVYDYNSKNESKYDPEGYCLPPGGPRMMATPYQMEIVQQPEHKRIFMIFEGATHIWREIYMDGRKFPEGDALNPTYLGYSVGRWENPDTLVVENKGFNENSWLDYFGHPHTDQMHIVEGEASRRQRALIACKRHAARDAGAAHMSGDIVSAPARQREPLAFEVGGGADARVRPRQDQLAFLDPGQADQLGRFPLGARRDGQHIAALADQRRQAMIIMMPTQFRS